jgi:hypothetical protein
VIQCDALIVGGGPAGSTAARLLHGHAYLGSGVGPSPVIGPGVMLVGDAAGLAYSESGEGIRPAIESGRLVAKTLIAALGQRGIDDLQPYADAIRRLHPAVREPPLPCAPPCGTRASASYITLHSLDTSCSIVGSSGQVKNVSTSNAPNYQLLKRNRNAWKLGIWKLGVDRVLRSAL